MKEHIQRCINLDWLEIYALEPLNEQPHNAEYFRNVGLQVVERDYGTPIYFEMFKIYGSDGLPLLEIRRNPKSAQGLQNNGVLDPRSCHIRLCNRTCYFENAAALMQQFINTYHYHLQRISRVDVCLDFEYFDYGDEPQKFLNRYINGKFSKINQSAISLHGLDCWDGRYWNSVKWGSPKSMVSTKFYDKTKELREQSDKPYIRQAWYAAGLIDDWRTMEKKNASGTIYEPRIWRLEFSIKSSEKNWFVVENPYNTKPKLRSIRHTLDRYQTRQQMCDVFFSLVEHYFHFKYVEYTSKDNDKTATQIKRKDRCRDKRLFKTDAINVFYKLTTINTSEKKDEKTERLLRYLYAFQATTIEPKIHKALYTLIEHLERRTHMEDAVSHLDETTIKVMQLLIQRRMATNHRSFEDDIATIRHYIENEPTIF